MAIAKDSKNCNNYIESFFHESSKNYLNNQQIAKIIRFTIKNSDGSILLSDIFEYNKNKGTNPT